MIADIQLVVPLLAVIAAVAVVAARVNIPSSILLVLVGVGLALLPGLPTVQLSPDLLLLLVLPPVIYSSAVAMSWREFKFNLRPISQLAIGCVAFTTLAVAIASHWLLHLSWQIGFALGRRRRVALGSGGRLDDAAPSPLGARPANRNHAVRSDTLPRLLAS
jgi:CPA1 family monovalent cation:H+ antiporter